MTTCVQVVKSIRNNEQRTPSIPDSTNTFILMRFIMLMAFARYDFPVPGGWGGGMALAHK